MSAAVGGTGGSGTAPAASTGQQQAMAAAQEQLQRRAAELLRDGTVAVVIGWGRGRFANQSTPVFIREPSDAGGLIFDEYCVNSLAKYVLDQKHRGRVAVCARGCDARGINRLIADGQIAREDVYLLGLPCPGMRDRVTEELLDTCTVCTHPNPVVYDELLAAEVAQPPATTSEGRFASVEAIEAMSVAQRREYFDQVFRTCIRCYACRDVCPCCSCRECFVDTQRVGWQGKQNNLPENRFYGLTRIFHIADRCIECGQCERVCPMDLPLMALNRKMIRDLERLFEADEAGLDDAGLPALGSYDQGDVEEFM
ncbi:MAG: 4Fe-4S dicluster domain-containing protein [Coriobacteriales bacterium]|jgi:ferredoxin|nr:4Fe-4S dicluster domain-containing protein [Coriobacteriales bacterium]